MFPGKEEVAEVSAFLPARFLPLTSALSCPWYLPFLGGDSQTEGRSREGRVGGGGGGRGRGGL